MLLNMRRFSLLWFAFLVSNFSWGQNSDTALISIENFRLRAGTYSWRDGETFHDMTSWNSSPYQEFHLQQRSGSNWRFRMNFRLLPPNNYDPNYAEGYPLLIMFHGAGERGNCWDTNCYCTDCDPNAPVEGKAAVQYLNNDHMLVHGGQPFMNAVNRAGSRKVGDPNLDPRAFPGFVLFPQMENNWGSATSTNSSVAHALRILRLVIKQYNVNPDRVYLAGLSMGGQAALKSITMADWLFAAAICMSPVPFTSDFDYENGVSIPLWIFQGGKDQLPKPSQTEQFIKRFREAGGSVRYTFYEELGHNTWSTAFTEPEFFSWLLKEKKNNLFKYFDSNYICASSNEGLKLGMPAGFPAYQWERNGQIINGENKATFIATQEGEYRGRFSRVQSPKEDDWNDWSNVVELYSDAPPTPELSHEGTTFLPDLNNNNEAVFYATEGFPYYYWHRDGTVISLPDSNRVVLKNDNGSYSVRVADYNKCPSPPSKAFPVFFSNRAPVVNSMRPQSLNAEPISPSSVFLHWSDGTLETGYEVWRKNTSIDGSRWELATITNKDVTFYYDTLLIPGSVYHYKIRGISSTARSDYFPSNDLNDNIAVELEDGNSIPLPPQNVTAELVDVNKVKVSWEPGKDESGIKEYLINAGNKSYRANSLNTVFFLTDLGVNRNYPVTVQTVDISGNVSPHSNQVIVSTSMTGFFYRHSTGAWNSLSDTSINDTWADPEYTGKVANLTLSPRVQDEYFNFEFNGYLKIDVAGTYVFYLNSDDGSHLFLNNELVIDYDGFHSTCQGDALSTTCPNGWGKPSQPMFLSQGIHLLKVRFFQYTGGRNLVLRYAGPDTGFSTITVPDGAITSGSSPALTNPTTPSNLTGRAEGMRSIALQWQASTPSSAEYEVYRGEQREGTFRIINRVSTTSFVDDGLIPGKRYYYRLRAVTATGNSGLSSTIGVTTESDSEAPSTPSSLHVERGNLSRTILMWDASSDNVEVAGYEVWANGQLIGFSPVPAFEAELESGEIYEFWVVAVDLSGNKSEESERVTNEPFITDAETNIPGDVRLSIYPNPGSSSAVRISFTTPTSGTLVYRLMDLQSRELISRETQVTGGLETEVAIDKYLPDGLYILLLNHAGMDIRTKLIIHNE